MNWNGNDVTRVPTLIYQTELIAGVFGPNMTPDPVGTGVLSCSSNAATMINWNYVDRVIATQNNGNIILRVATMRTQILQNQNTPLPAGGRPEDFLNGLWSCTQGGTRLHVGVYSSSGKFIVAQYSWV